MGLTTGFRVFNAENFDEIIDRDMDGGVGQVEVLGQSNIIALRGGGRYPFISLSKVVLWEEQYSKVICELSFPKKNVHKVKIAPDHLLVQLFDRTYIYEFASELELVQRIKSPGHGCIAIQPYAS